MHWPYTRQPDRPASLKTYVAQPQPAAGGAVSAARPGGRYAATSSTGRVSYGTREWTPLLNGVTPDQCVRTDFYDKTWYRVDLCEPPCLSQKKHTGLGSFIKKCHSLSAKNASRKLGSGHHLPYVSHPQVQLTEIFATVPASRRRAVSDVLHTLGKRQDLEGSFDRVRPLATLLARRSSENLLADTASTKLLMAHWPKRELEAAAAILAWLERLPKPAYKGSVAQVDAFLHRHSVSDWQINGFFRALTLIGAEHLPAAFTQGSMLMSASSALGEAPATFLLTVLARVPPDERDALVQQTKRAWRACDVPMPLTVLALLSQVAPSERTALAGWLGDFFTALQQARRPKHLEFFNHLLALPQARRELYLQALAGCLVAANIPTYRPCDLSVATLWLYYGHIDHLAPLSNIMELRLSNTICRLMDLANPTQEIAALVTHAKTLSHHDGQASAQTLQAMAAALVSVEPPHRERFTLVAMALFGGVPSDDDRIAIAQILSAHVPESWSTLQEACSNLQHANLYPNLLAEGVQFVLRMSTAETANEVCKTFLDGGMASAAQPNLSR